jgi:hypothetical protein
MVVAVNQLEYRSRFVLLSADSIVFDLGIIDGAIARGVVSWFRGRVLGVEPEPTTSRGRLSDIPGVVKEQAPVRPVIAAAVLDLTEARCASTQLDLGAENSLAVNATILTSHLDRKASPIFDLVKVDIEGAELDLMDRVRDRVRMLTCQPFVEFHKCFDPSVHSRVEPGDRRLKGQCCCCCFRFTRPPNGDLLQVYPDVEVRRRQPGMLLVPTPSDGSAERAR